MDILTTENAIIDRAKDKIPDLLTEAFPEDPENYTLTHAKGAILVQYAGSTFDDPEDSGAVVQDEHPAWTLTLLAKNLRTHTGAYKYIEDIKTAFTGYVIPGPARLYLKEIIFLGLKDGGIFMYGTTIAFNTIHEEPE